MRWFIVILWLLSTPVMAQSVSVRAGEHGEFTRLVLTFPLATDWALGRTHDGYELRASGGSGVFDLTQVYDVIDSNRLRSIWADPQTGHLQLGIGCACHIIPFSLDPRTVVLDIHEGDSPPQSSFETSLSGGNPLPPLAGIAKDRPQSRPPSAKAYNWLTQPPASTKQAAELSYADPTTHGLTTDVRLDPFRTMLIEELGRGATAGVIEMEVPPLLIDDTTAPSEQPDQARAALDSLPGIKIVDPDAASPDLTVTGVACPDFETVDISQWSEADNAIIALSEARGKLLAEFDVPDQNNVIAAVRTHLYFGFGAEARGILLSFLTESQREPFLVALSYILDATPPPKNPFADLHSCASPAALWSVLATPNPLAADQINGDAVAQTFLGLPKHLRQSLGPAVFDRLNAAGDAGNAEVVKQAFARSAEPDTPAVALIEAEQSLLLGEPEAAEEALPPPDRSDQALQQLLLLAEARFQQGKPLAEQDLLALEAFAFELEGSPSQPDLDRALTHAFALNGNFAKAFAQAAQSEPLVKDVWSILAKNGSAAMVLEFGVGVPKATQMTLDPHIRGSMAARLMDAGLPNAASDWLLDLPKDSDLSARVALANNDARQALRALSALGEKADKVLLASAYQTLGAYEDASNALQEANLSDQARRLQIWQNKWPLAGTQQQDDWAAVAQFLEPTLNAETMPPLQASQAQLENSARTRDAVASLLAVATPPEPQQ